MTVEAPTEGWTHGHHLLLFVGGLRPFYGILAQRAKLQSDVSKPWPCEAEGFRKSVESPGQQC